MILTFDMIPHFVMNTVNVYLLNSQMLSLFLLELCIDPLEGTLNPLQKVSKEH